MSFSLRSFSRRCAAEVVGLLSAGATGLAESHFTEFIISGEFTYPYGVMAADLDGNGASI
jgi:hypothetical protein